MAEESDRSEDMLRAYEPAGVEQKWYRYWMEKGYFKPEIDLKKKPFVIIMPPPNITGELHLGHALTATIEDIMTRWHRMMGEPTLWLPGVDHAGIATQMVVEKELAREGKTKADIGREKFLERVWQWANKYRHRILVQHQRLGASCDWDRERFTLDEGPCKAVRTAFVSLYEKGLIYKGERIINWCPRCVTALSDLEVDHKELTSNLYYVRYPLADEEGKFITVATTRPETILGDTAVAVNPDDERYKNMVGRKVVLPAVKRVIPVIADEAVSLEFGTGAVKITPAHDPVDFEVAQRNDIGLINILNDDATMNKNAGPYEGLDRFECRKKLLEDLDKEGFLMKVEPYAHSVGHCHRCATVIEPLASRQWFVKMEPLAKPAIEAVTEGRIKIIPERFNKVYLNWMENIRDWCISRQLWWGHRIPVWYCRSCGEVIVSVVDPDKCPKCTSSELKQDDDVLDTWFSSGLWPHSTLGWPDETEDMAYFYPTSVMETAYDILFFWVARMIVMGLENTGDIPFHTVYLHGLIRDEKGEKMSKTRGNVLDPLKLMDKYGTDAMRFAILAGTSPGNDTKLGKDKLEAGRNFANKLWNATRFVLKVIKEADGNFGSGAGVIPMEDRWILSRMEITTTSVNKLMADYQFGEAQRKLYDFIWGDFCDWYIEIAKVRLHSKDNKASPIPMLVKILEFSLRLLHPYMPFITEELWQHLKKSIPGGLFPVDSIMIADYPRAGGAGADERAEKIISSVIEVIRAVRNARAENNVAASRFIEVQLYTGELAEYISLYAKTIKRLARIEKLIVSGDTVKKETAEDDLVTVAAGVTIVIPMAAMVDRDAEKEKKEREIKQLAEYTGKLESRLKDKQFLDKAPEAVIEKERQKLASLNERLKLLKASRK